MRRSLLFMPGNNPAMLLAGNLFEADGVILDLEDAVAPTEKDAARLTQFSNLDEKIQKNIYTLPIEVRFLQNEEEAFNQNIIEYVRKNKRDSSLPEREDAY